MSVKARRDTALRHLPPWLVGGSHGSEGPQVHWRDASGVEIQCYSKQNNKRRSLAPPNVNNTHPPSSSSTTPSPAARLLNHNPRLLPHPPQPGSLKKAGDQLIHSTIPNSLYPALFGAGSSMIEGETSCSSSSSVVVVAGGGGGGLMLLDKKLRATSIGSSGSFMGGLVGTVDSTAAAAATAAATAVIGREDKEVFVRGTVHDCAKAGCERVTINVSGQRFETQLRTLNRFPDTLLGDSEKRRCYWDDRREEYFLDRHRPTFQSILYFYQSGGRLKRPIEVPEDVFLEELKFYQLGEEAIESFKIKEGIMDNQAVLSSSQILLKDNTDWQRRLWLFCEEPDSCMEAKIFAVISIICIIVSVTTFCMETLPAFDRSHCLNITTTSNSSSTASSSSYEKERKAYRNFDGGHITNNNRSGSMKSERYRVGNLNNSPDLGNEPVYLRNLNNSLDLGNEPIALGNLNNSLDLSNKPIALRNLNYSLDLGNEPFYLGNLNNSHDLGNEPVGLGHLNNSLDLGNDDGLRVRLVEWMLVHNYWDPFFIVETICVVWFTLEFMLRLISCPSKRDFCRGVMNIFDAAAILPYFVVLVTQLVQTTCADGGERNAGGTFVIVRILRVVRIFKLSKHSQGLRILGLTIKTSIRELGMFFFFLIVAMVIFSSAVYYAEMGEPNTQLNSIPGAFWWAVVTMTTVGYGDVTPVGVWGKLVGTLCVIAGVLTIALPVPVVVANFNNFYRHES